MQLMECGTLYQQRVAQCYASPYHIWAQLLEGRLVLTRG